MTLGSDFSAVADLDSSLSFLSGKSNEETAFMQAIARRLSTPRFGLFYDPTYGMDLRMFIADQVPIENVQGLIESECRKDERTKDATASISVGGSGDWTVSVSVETQDGDMFSLTLSVDSVSVEILE